MRAERYRYRGAQIATPFTSHRRGRPSGKRAGTGRPTAENAARRPVRDPTGAGPGPDRADPAAAARPTGAGHDYVRHGTTTLFAALELATGRIEQACLPRHRHQEFLTFLKRVARPYPRRRLHLVVDNYATHKHPGREQVAGPAPADHPALHPDLRVVWLNLAEVFSIITPLGHPSRQPQQHHGVDHRHRAIHRRLERTCHPFVWTKTADELLDHCRPGQKDIVYATLVSKSRNFRELEKQDLEVNSGDADVSRLVLEQQVGETWRGVLCLLGGVDGVVKIDLTA
jgi:hypothetical protein